MNSKNFEFIKEKNSFENYYNQIIHIESRFDQDILLNDLHKLIRDVFVDLLKGENCQISESMSFNKIKETVFDRVQYKLNINNNNDTEIEISRSFRNAVAEIQANRNTAEHTTDKLTNGFLTPSKKINYLSATHYIFKYLFVNYYNVNLKPHLLVLDENYYYQYLDVKNIPKTENEEMVFDNGQIKIKSYDIGSFILDETNFFLIPEYQRGYS